MHHHQGNDSQHTSLTSAPSFVASDGSGRVFDALSAPLPGAAPYLGEAVLERDLEIGPFGAPRRKRTPSKLPKLCTPEARKENSEKVRTRTVDAMRAEVAARVATRQLFDLDRETGELSPRVWDATREVRAALEKDAKSASPVAEAPALRRRQYALQDTAARLRPGMRVSHCTRTRAGSLVDVRMSANGQAYYGGLQTCGSVWECPCCSARITAQRRDEMNEALEFARSNGLHLSLLTLTAPHGPRDELGALQLAHRQAYRYFGSGKRALKQLLDGHGYIGTIRAQEVTHGRNGWHPHWHVLVFTAAPISDTVETSIYQQWQRCAARAGLGEVDRQALHLDRSIRLTGDEVVGALGLYVCKWGAAEELTRSHVKKAGRGGRSPWQLLGDATDGDTQAGALWAEFAAVYKGQRQLVWSQGLRDLMGLKEPLTDQEAAELEPEGWHITAQLDGDQWRAVRVGAFRSALLDVAQLGAGALVLSSPERARLAVAEWLARLPIPERDPELTP